MHTADSENDQYQSPAMAKRWLRRWMPGLVALCVVVLLPFAIGYIAAPSSLFASPHSLSSYWVGNVLPVVIIYLVILGLTRRVFASAIATIGLFAVTVGISNLKFHVLGTPIIASDFYLVGQLVRNISLFVQYAFSWTGLAVLVGAVACAFAAARLAKEKPLTRRPTYSIAAAIGVIGLFTWVSMGTVQPESAIHEFYGSLNLTYKPWNIDKTVRFSGLLASLVMEAKGLAVNVPYEPGHLDELMAAVKKAPDTYDQPVDPSRYPNIIVIQSEAFADIRRADPKLPPGYYSQWDKLKEQGISGYTRLETYGGGTLRSGFSFLTGAPIGMFGASGSYPYYTITTHPVESIATTLKKLGYSVKAMQPSEPMFWNRKVAFPLMGFDDLLSINEMPEVPTVGHWPSDIGLLQRAFREVQSAKKPAFLFVITAENHGPWGYNRGGGDMPGDLSYLSGGAEYRLRQYAWVLQHTFEGLERLYKETRKLKRPTLILFYGDHWPALSEYLADVGIKRPWRNDSVHKGDYLLLGAVRHVDAPKIIHIGYMAAYLLESAGLPQNTYYQAAGYMMRKCGDKIMACKAVPADRREGYKEMILDRMNLL